MTNTVFFEINFRYKGEGEQNDKKKS